MGARKVKRTITLKRWSILKRHRSRKRWILLKECKTEIEMQQSLALIRKFHNTIGFTKIKLRVDEYTITRRTILER